MFYQLRLKFAKFIFEWAETPLDKLATLPRSHPTVVEGGDVQLCVTVNCQYVVGYFAQQHYHSFIHSFNGAFPPVFCRPGDTELWPL